LPQFDWNLPEAAELIERALIEDRAHEDATTRGSIDPKQPARARVLAKQELVIAGSGLIAKVFEVFAKLNNDGLPPATVTLLGGVEDGVQLTSGAIAAEIEGRAAELLSCERVTLNLLQHLSGIATEARKYVDAIAGTGATLLDTRKTIPGLRALEKYAVHCGGATNHRMDLADGILVKNNHIDLGGGVKQVLEKLLAERTGDLKIEVEVRDMRELEQAINNGAEAILLDNMTPEQTAVAVARVRRETRRIPIESSGGITIENIRDYALAGVDYISVGALTHSSPAVDLSMRIEPLEQ